MLCYINIIIQHDSISFPDIRNQRYEIRIVLFLRGWAASTSYHDAENVLSTVFTCVGRCSEKAERTLLFFIATFSWSIRYVHDSSRKSGIILTHLVSQFLVIVIFQSPFSISLTLHPEFRSPQYSGIDAVAAGA